MAGNKVEQFRMETNFHGLIQLDLKHLYPEADVFLRELIQNAHDGIQRRRTRSSRMWPVGSRSKTTWRGG